MAGADDAALEDVNMELQQGQGDIPTTLSNCSTPLLQVGRASACFDVLILKTL
jgi:hypothetical protein